MNAEELQKYWNELATDAGLPEEQVTAVGTLFQDEGARKVFQKGFVTRSESSRALTEKDKAVKEAKEKQDAYLKKVLEFQSWADDTMVPLATSLEDKVKQYEELYGPIDGDNTPGRPPNPSNPNPNSNGHQYLTPEQLDERMNKALTSVLDIQTEMMAVNNEHIARTGKPLDTMEFRKALETSFQEAQQSGQPTSVRQVYQQFAKDELDEINEKSIQDRIKAEAEKLAEQKIQERSREKFPAGGVDDSLSMRPDIRPQKDADRPNDSDVKSDFIDAWYNPSGGAQQGANAA